MRKAVLLILLICTVSRSAFSQYWQQQVNYDIVVALNDKDHSLDGFERITYFNNSPDTISFIWFHLWPNAYKNDRTALSDQLLENGQTKFYFSSREERGYINRLDFKVDNVTATLEDHPNHIDIAKLILPFPLAPGDSTLITTPFHVQLPGPFSRGGHEGQSYQATQWYPKPAVYDSSGWHPMPYLDQGEFYSEFGNFRVQITVPSNYVVAATGDIKNEEEKTWLKTRAAFFWKPIVTRQKIKGGSTKTTVQEFPSSASTTKTLMYEQARVHDFAWFADKRFIVDADTCKLPNGKIIDVYTFYTPAHQEIWKSAITHAKKAVLHYSSLVGQYPYNVVSCVQGPASTAGGMEYPTITVLSHHNSEQALDQTIAHEVGHNWFYGILGSNERRYPWMDEGINTYYDYRYQLAKGYKTSEILQQNLLETFYPEKKDQAMNTSSEKFSSLNYGLIAYFKTGEWMKLLEKEIGQPAMDRAMQEYYTTWKFRHPQPADFQRVMEKASGKNLDTLFALLQSTGPLPTKARKGFALQSPVSLAVQANENKKTVVTLLPAFGINSYDKLMAGVTITNLRLPPNKLQFLLAPMYAFGSKQVNGIGFINHSFYPGGIFRKISLGVMGARFSADRFTDAHGKKTFLNFTKIAPGIKFVFKENNPRSHKYRFIQYKAFFLGEEGLRFFRDSIFNPTDTIIFNNYRKEREQSTLHQLKLVVENNRALYPYRGELKIEQGRDFARAAFTGNYFFNYPKTGGLDVRIFAGKFFYTTDKTISKQFATSRYHLNMTGANGYEDYTYSDYFIGRNKFEGFASQQIMRRDGGFKVRTDLLAEKVGRSDDWLFAVNLTTTIPKGINPLSVLPFNLPLRLFADVGTEASAWLTGATNDRFLFDAGIQLSFFKETVHFYLPILYSRVFRDYIQSTIEKKGRLWKTVSFTIDISNLTARKFDRNLDF